MINSFSEYKSKTNSKYFVQFDICVYENFQNNISEHLFLFLCII